MLSKTQVGRRYERASSCLCVCVWPCCSRRPNVSPAHNRSGWTPRHPSMPFARRVWKMNTLTISASTAWITCTRAGIDLWVSSSERSACTPPHPFLFTRCRAHVPTTMGRLRPVVYTCFKETNNRDTDMTGTVVVNLRAEPIDLHKLTEQLPRETPLTRTP